MKLKGLIMSLIITICFSCKKTETQKTPEMTVHENPLLTEWNTPFGVPPFDIIKNEDYLPAFNTALTTQKKEIKTIIENKEAPNFTNTIEAIEISGSDLSKVRRVFFALNGANTNDTLKTVAKEIAPILSAHHDDIILNKALFERVKAVYNQKDGLNLEAEELYLLTETYKIFVRSGVNLEGDNQNRLREINAKLASLSQKFGENLLDETNSFEYYTANKKDLGNLPESLVALAATEAKTRGHENGWSFTLQRPSINPFLQASPNRDARQKLFDGYALRGNNKNDKDNTILLQETASLRVEKAKLLGYETYADFVLSNTMAENPEAVFSFMDKLWTSALNMAKKERKALAEEMKNDGVSEKFNGSDWRYYVEKVRKERYSYDEDETRPYFEFTAVRNGAFKLAEKLFGLSFKELNNVPKWHEDQQVFEVLDADQTHLGIIYMDFFARESKRGGAWMNSLRSQSNMNGMVNPIVTTNFNYPAPTENSPSLLSFTEAETLFHEFGHALHGLFSKVKYESLSGTSVPRDFVEFPSQVMENWMSEPEVLKLFAKHYKTGKVIPDEMIKKMKEANSFNGGFATVEYMAAAYLDMKWHTIKDTTQRNAITFENETMNQLGLIDEIIPRYRSSYFAHIFSGGYSSRYYSYLWSEVLDADAFQAFKDSGNIFDAETAKHYRKMLSQGGSKSGMDLYKEFRGHEPDIEPLLKKKGFL